MRRPESRWQLAGVADDEGLPRVQQRRVEFAAVAAPVDHPDPAPAAGRRDLGKGGLDLLVLRLEVGRPLGIERAVEGHDGAVLVLHPDHLAQPIAFRKAARAAVADPGQVLHLPRIGLGDVREVQNQKRSIADPGAALAQDRGAEIPAQLHPAKVARQPRFVLASAIVSSSARPISLSRTLPRAAIPYSASDTKRRAGLLKPEESFPEYSSATVKIVQMGAHLAGGSHYHAQGPPFVEAGLPSVRTGSLPHAEGPPRRQKFPQKSAVPLPQTRSKSQIKNFAL